VGTPFVGHRELEEEPDFTPAPITDPEIDFTPLPRVEPPGQGRGEDYIPKQEYWEPTPPPPEPEPEPEPELDPMTPYSPPKFTGEIPIFKIEPDRWVVRGYPGGGAGRPGRAEHFPTKWSRYLGEYPSLDSLVSDDAAARGVTIKETGYAFEPSFGAGGLDIGRSSHGLPEGTPYEEWPEVSYEDMYGDYYTSDAYRSFVEDLAYRAKKGPGKSGLSIEEWEAVWPKVEELSEYVHATRADPRWKEYYRSHPPATKYYEPYRRETDAPPGWKPISGYYP
jgi:hypothetical protein